MILETSRGPIDDSRLALTITESTTPEGTLVSRSYFLDGELVKLDQHMKISEAAMLRAVGCAQL